MSTLHIEANEEDIASLVLMPGDPNRCKYIADNYLTNSKLVNSLRGATAYTGYYRGIKITLFPSGMGIPSMGIYSHELFDYYNVDTIIRIGTAGAYTESIKLYDVFLADSAYSNTIYDEELTGESLNVVNSSLELNTRISETAENLGINLLRGRTFTTDAFYSNPKLSQNLAVENNCDVVEMESFALFLNAKKYHKKATSLLTVTDEIYSDRRISPKEREIRLNVMIRLALETIIKL